MISLTDKRDLLEFDEHIYEKKCGFVKIVKTT